MAPNQLLPVVGIVLVVVVAGLSGTAAGTAASPTDATTGPFEAAAATAATNHTPTVALSRAVVRVQRGSVAPLQLLLRGTETATVTVDGANDSFAATVVVTDRNADGLVVLRVDTAATGDGAVALAASSDDAATVSTVEPSTAESLSPGDYDIDVYAGSDVGGDAVDVSTLLVVPSGGLPVTNVTYTGRALTLHPASGQVVAGTTELEPGRTVSVRLQATDSSSTFVVSREATVSADGRFEATFDLRDVAPGTSASATVGSGGTRLASDVPVEIVSAAGDGATTGDPSGGPTGSPGQSGFGAGLATLVVVLALLVERR